MRIYINRWFVQYLRYLNSSLTHLLKKFDTLYKADTLLCVLCNKTSPRTSYSVINIFLSFVVIEPIPECLGLYDGNWPKLVSLTQKM